MSLFTRKPSALPSPEEALPGRDAPIPVVANHLVLGTPLVPPFPEGSERLVVGMGCFWGAERLFWQRAGVHTTAVGYAGGFTPNPTYEEMCSGRTGHTEVVLVVFDPRTSDATRTLLRVFWEGHDPTQGMRQGNDRRHAVPLRDLLARRGVNGMSRSRRARCSRPSSTEQASDGRSRPRSPRPARSTTPSRYHQQYLAANPNGYCGLGSTGVPCPIGTGVGA